MKSIKGLFGLVALSLLVLVLPSAASAQWGNRDNDDIFRNGRDATQMRAAIDRLKNRSRELDRRLERELDRRNNRFVNTRQVLNLSDDFKDAADKLEDKFGRGRDLRNSERFAREVIQLGQELDRELTSLRLNRDYRNELQAIRQDLRIIANGYGLNYNGGSWRDRLPVRWPF